MSRNIVLQVIIIVIHALFPYFMIAISFSSSSWL